MTETGIASESEPRTLSERVQARAFERRWWILTVLCISLLVIVLDNSILNVAIPTIVRDLGASEGQIQWIVDAYTLVFAGLLLTMGSLGDRFGRRGALQAGFLVFGAGSIASALAGSANQLIATRAFMGIGGALIMPATLSIITNVFPGNERPRAISIWAGVAGLGAALGPLTGGFLVEHFYWGSVFLVNIPIVLFGLVTGFFLIPTSKDPAAPRLDPFGAALSIGALSSLLFGIIQAPLDGWTAPLIVGAFVVGVVLLAVFVWWELTTDHPMLDVRFFKNPRFSAASGSITLVFFAMFGSIFLLTQYLQFTLGYSPLKTGVRLLPFAVAMMISAPLSARIVERVGTKIVVATGLGLVTAGLVLSTGLSASSPYQDIIWRLILMSFGMGMVMAPATDSVMGSLPLAKAGVGSAVNDTTRQVGGALGVAVLGSVLSSGFGPKIDSFFKGTPIPTAARHTAREGVGNALAVADQLRTSRLPNASAFAADLVRTANHAFVDSFHSSLLVGAAATLIGVFVAVRWLPAHPRDADVAVQAEEYAAEREAEHWDGEDGERAPARDLAPAPTDG
ncbi:MAG TPA: MFS transporter [Acidimicrobiia bacterium]